MYIYTVTVACYNYFVIFFSLLSLLVFVFSFFFLSCLCFFFPSLSLLIYSLLQWVWSTSSSTSSFQPASMGLINLFFSHSFSVGPLCRRRLRLEWVWSTFTPINLFVFAWSGLGFSLIWVLVSSGFRLRSTMRMRNEKITKLGSERSGFWLDGGWVMMTVVGSGRERERGSERERGHE